MKTPEAASRGRSAPAEPPGERAVLVGLAQGRKGRERALASLEELAALAGSAGACVVEQVVQERRRPDPATLVGRGKVVELAALCAEREAELLVFDNDLSPGQLRNLEKAVEVRTLDRTQLILDIFAERARTREGRLQVELAQLAYLLPRLSGRGVLLSRLGGGIGTRGPGETKLETDRRRINARMRSLRHDIDGVRRERATRRSARRRHEQPLVALVGYTNAGKSTLFNALTQSSTEVSDRLFMTLDPLVRSARLSPGCEVLLTDTVGFIQKLPHPLVAAFRATLEEVVEADLLVHIQDASVDDLEQRQAAVDAVLREIGAEARPRLLVLNKIDRVPDERLAGLRDSQPGSVAVSAHTGQGLGDLRDALARRLDIQPRAVRLRFAAAEARLIAGVYAAGRVLTHEVEGDVVTLAVELPARLLSRYQARLVG